MQSCQVQLDCYVAFGLLRCQFPLHRQCDHRQCNQQLFEWRIQFKKNEIRHVKMALFGLLWLMRVRQAIRKDNQRTESSDGGGCDPAGRALEAGILPLLPLIPPPISFADSASFEFNKLPEDIPPPPPPPRVRIRPFDEPSPRLASGIRTPLDDPALWPILRMQAQQFSHSDHDIPRRMEQCTCPNLMLRRPCVRFRDDPQGMYSARRQRYEAAAESWNYPSVVTTFPRNRMSKAVRVQQNGSLGTNANC